MSLYLAVGLPVIIWEKAAEAEFVLKENVGVIVKSLYELPQRLASVSYNDYNIMKNNVRIVGERLRKGEYMMEAIRKAEKIIYESRKMMEFNDIIESTNKVRGRMQDDLSRKIYDCRIMNTLTYDYKYITAITKDGCGLSFAGYDKCLNHILISMI